MSERCQTCWNLLSVCPCAPPEDACGFHGWGGRPGRRHLYCTCGPEPLMDCARCREMFPVDAAWDDIYCTKCWELMNGIIE